jgi:hypothetical protein
MRRAALAHFVQIVLPAQTSELSERLGLFPQANQQPQALFDCGTLGRQAGGRHGLGQQRVVDIDVGPHSGDPIFVYSLATIYTSPDCRNATRELRMIRQAG